MLVLLAQEADPRSRKEVRALAACPTAGREHSAPALVGVVVAEHPTGHIGHPTVAAATPTASDAVTLHERHYARAIKEENMRVPEEGAPPPGWRRTGAAPQL